MICTVVQLRLSGKSPDEAIRAAREVVDDRSVPDLSHLLVVNDTAALWWHAEAFGHLLASGRVPYLVCLAVGPPAQRGRIWIPGNIGPGQGSAILWVGDQSGVEWPVAASAVPQVRPESGPNGVELPN